MVLKALDKGVYLPGSNGWIALLKKVRVSFSFVVNCQAY